MTMPRSSKRTRQQLLPFRVAEPDKATTTATSTAVTATATETTITSVTAKPLKRQRTTTKAATSSTPSGAGGGAGATPSALDLLGSSTNTTTSPQSNHTELQRITQLGKGGNLWYTPNLVPPKQRKQLLNALIAECKPESLTVRMYGKNIPMPRLQAAHGDAGLSYRFSGIEVKAKPWTPSLLHLKADVEAATGETFNFCLVNLYRGPGHHISYHSDDERDLVS